MLFKPCLETLPARLGFCLAVGGAIIGKKSVGCIGVDDDFGIAATKLKAIAHLLHRIKGNTRVLATVEAENGVTKTLDITGQPLTTCFSTRHTDLLTEGCPVMSSVSLGGQ